MTTLRLSIPIRRKWVPHPFVIVLTGSLAIWGIIGLAIYNLARML